MNAAALAMTGELKTMLASVDPRTLPVRFSRLKLMAQSARHYWHACQFGDGGSSLAQHLGSATHAVLFEQPFVVYPKRRAGKEWEAFEAEHAESLILSGKEHDEARAIADAVRSHPLASSLLFGPGMVRERRIDWKRDGRACRGTPDAFGHGIVVDLKTTKCAQPERFVRDATWRSYHAQLAWYANGLAESGNGTADELYIVAVENSGSHCVTVLKLDPSAWLMGEQLTRSWWEALMVAEATNTWNGYTDALVRFGVEENERFTIAGEEIDL